MAKMMKKAKAKKGGMMPANSPAGMLAAHLPVGKMGMTQKKAAKGKKGSY